MLLFHAPSDRETDESSEPRHILGKFFLMSSFAKNPQSVISKKNRQM